MNEVIPSNAPSPPRILLVDDNKLGLAARKVVLEEQGYHISLAREGTEALAQFTPGKFDLLITDYKMPRMNGLELIAKVRELCPGLPIILISGYAEALGLTEANTGADVVIPKSSTEVQQLVRTVGRLLRRSAPRKPAGSHKPKYKARSQSG
jgi:CheY-like chemotaxis protein